MRILLAALLAVAAFAQQQTADWTAADDHRHMMEQLGIERLRPGPSGNEQAPNAANYDEAAANPFPDFPDVLTQKNGRRVASADDWWKRRRPEIVEDFEREVYGRVPEHVPAVTWTVTSTVNADVAGRPVVGKRLVGRVDNSAHPAITVEMQLVLVTPADARRPAPVMIMFRGGGLPGEPAPEGRRGFGPPPGSAGGDPPATERLIAAGWGYAFLNPSSIQADNGAGLTKGIIGLVNKGQPRKPDDWGALRAWAWGAGRALDYLATDPAVDATRVGIEGVSRFGKAALVALAFDTRFAAGLIGSSGAGGAKPFRRNFGEAVENLTGSGQYHWMAGNFLKYGAAEAVFGSRNAGDIPVDSHQLIALCAPRPIFISYGVPEKGDARWLDQQGSYMATVAAAPVFRLLGARDLGTSEHYRTAKMPPVNAGLLGGHLAWRQHDGGHTDGPNWKYFIPWAGWLLAYSDAEQRVSLPTEDGGVIHADVYGTGSRAVVLAHGGRFNKESWGEQARALAKAGFRVIAIDFRGYGASRGPGQADIYTAPLHLDVLAAVRHSRKTGATSVSVVGGSLGGGAAANALAEAAPGEIDRLVLLAALPDTPPQRLTGPKLFVIARADADGAGPRLPRFRAIYDEAPEPKQLVVVDGSAHAQFLFLTDRNERVMREIVQFLSRP